MQYVIFFEKKIDLISIYVSMLMCILKKMNVYSNSFPLKARMALHNVCIFQA